MRKITAIACVVSVLLYSCNQNKPAASQIPMVGEAIDSAAIASDTFQQENLESSYEYAQTVIVSPKLAYDVRAYGGPAKRGEYCIIRRAEDNKPDTVVQGERLGIIVNAFTGDLNENGKEELYIVMKKTNRGASSYISAFEFDKNGKPKPITCYNNSDWSITANNQVYNDSIHPNGDTIFRKGNLLIYGYLPSNAKEERPYRLEGTSLVINFND